MLILFILICEAAGIIGGLFTSQAVSTWYKEIIKPSFNPPSWVFGPVWILLYALMGTAMYFVYQKHTSASKTALIFFGVHLIVNALWSFLFFGKRQFELAFLDIGVMWVMIVISIYLFYRVDHKAGLLLFPYLLWASFASVLNYSIWRLNA